MSDDGWCISSLRKRCSRVYTTITPVCCEAKQDNMRALENQLSETQQVKDLGGDAPMFVSGGTVGNTQQGESSVANKEEIDIDSEAPSVRFHGVVALWSITRCRLQTVWQRGQCCSTKNDTTPVKSLCSKSVRSRDWYIYCARIQPRSGKKKEGEERKKFCRTSTQRFRITTAGFFSFFLLQLYYTSLLIPGWWSTELMCARNANAENGFGWKECTRGRLWQLKTSVGNTEWPR